MNYGDARLHQRGRELHVTDLTADPAFQRHADAIHDLGPRAVCEALAGVMVFLDLPDRTHALAQISGYRRLACDMLAATGGDQMVPVSIMVVPDDAA